MTKNIVFIGGGNMAHALIGGLVARDYPAGHILVSEPVADRLDELAREFGIRTTTDNRVAAAEADVIVLAVKPQVMAAVAGDVADVVREHRPLVLSVAAGIRECDLSHWLGGDLAIVRTMPNRPALYGYGVTALCPNEHVSASDRETAGAIMQSVGQTIWVDNESLMDAVTAVSGSGPAYYFLLMEIIEETAIALGLDHEAARVLTVETAYGAAHMARDGRDEPSDLRRQVTSAGGTTAAALKVLESGDMRELMALAIKAANNRAKELSKEHGKD